MSAPGNCVLTIAVPPGADSPRSVLAGNMVRFLISITDVTGAPIDTSLSVQVGMSYADEVSLTPVHDGTGQYHADWNTTSAVAGTYYCVATGTGILNVAAEVSITLKAPHL